MYSSTFSFPTWVKCRIKKQNIHVYNMFRRNEDVIIHWMSLYTRKLT